MRTLTVPPSDAFRDLETLAEPSTALPGPTKQLNFVGELVLATAVAAGVSLVVQLLVGVVRVPVSSLVPVALGTLGGALLIGVLLVLSVRALRGRRLPGTPPLTWVALSATATLPLALMLLGTKHYIFGISGDQSFRVQYFTRFTDSAQLADIAYADLPPYYPAAWFWVGGRIADLAGVPGWEAYKPFAIATMAVAAVVAFCVWGLVVPRAQATLLALITTMIGLRIAAYQPYSWLLSAALPPLAVLAWRLLRAVRGNTAPRHWQASAVLVGLALGAAGIIHSLLFWFFGLLLVVMSGLAIAHAQPCYRLAATRRLATPSVVIGVVALPVVLLFWTPYIARLLQDGFRSGAAQRFLPESSTVWPMPMVEPTITGALALVGTVWMAARWRSSDTAQALGIMVLTVYGWFALSTLALAASTTLLAFRLEPALVAALVCGGVLGMLDGFRTATRWIRTTSTTHSRPLPLTAVVFVLSFAALLSMVETVPQAYEWSEKAQFGDYYPSGVTPVGISENSDAGAWNDELLAAIDGMSDAQARELVVLSTHHDLFAYRPYFTFQTRIAQYANPLADFASRRMMIERWADSPTSAQLVAALDSAPVRPPTVFVLRRQPDGLHLGLTHDTFPAFPNTRSRTVVFDAALFDDPAFRRRDVGPFTVIVRRASATDRALSGSP